MSKVIPVFRAEIAEGKVKIGTPQKFKEYVQTLAGKKLDLILRPHQQIRSLRQNAYYWAVYVPIMAEHCGYDEEEMHNALKIKFLRKEGGLLPTVQSTKQLSTAEFYEYMAKIDRLAAEYGLKIPTPEEYYEEAYGGD